MMTSYTVGPETERLAHRAFEIEDAEAFYALNANRQVMRLTGEPPIESVELARDAIENYQDFKTIGYGRWACILKETDQIIGFCGLKFLPEFDVVDVGYRFLPEYWGRGIATEACRASLKFGFQSLQLESIFGFVLPENSGSIRVLEKVGMKKDREVDYDGMLALQYSIDSASFS